MANLSNSIKVVAPIAIKLPHIRSHPATFSFTSSSQLKAQTASFSPSSSKDDHSSPKLMKKKNSRKKAPRAPRPLITISTSNGRWPGQWTCDYVLSLRELQLADLAEDGQDAEVFVSLTIHKHASFGFSIDGRVITSFSRKCNSCFSPYIREIDTTFDVWVLPSSRIRESQLPEIGGNDPSVIYVTPGSEADLDSLVQDTIRLTASAKDTCSESCEKSTIIWQYTDGKRSYDRRWSRLLELKNSI